MAAGKVEQVAHGLRGEDCSGWVAWCVNEKQARAGRDQALQVRDVGEPGVARVEWIGDDHSATGRELHGIEGPAGIGQKYFVAWADCGGEGGLEGGWTAPGDGRCWGRG